MCDCFVAIFSHLAFNYLLGLYHVQKWWTAKSPYYRMGFLTMDVFFAFISEENLRLISINKL